MVGQYPAKATILAPRWIKQASEVVFNPKVANMNADTKQRIGKLQQYGRRNVVKQKATESIPSQIN